MATLINTEARAVIERVDEDETGEFGVLAVERGESCLDIEIGDISRQSALVRDRPLAAGPLSTHCGH